MRDKSENTVRVRWIAALWFLLSVSIWLYGILPLLKSCREWEHRCLEYEMRLEQIQEKEMLLTSVRERHVQAQKELDGMNSRYLPYSHSSEIGQEIMSGLRAAGITVMSMEILMPEAPLYGEEEETDPGSGIWVAEANVTLSGEKEQLESVLEHPEIYGSGIRLTGFRWEDSVLHVKWNILMYGEEQRP